MGRRTCVVVGCHNTSMTHPNLTFYTLPKDPGRRSMWLQLISRQELMDKKSQYFSVCELHFESHCFTIHSNRKVLKKNSYPLQNLPNAQNLITINRHETDTDTIDSYTQTDDVPISSASSSLGKRENMPFTDCRKRLKTNESENDTFHGLCDRFLTKELAEMVKVQTRLQSIGKESMELKQFFIDMYYSNPQTYRFLQQTLDFPSTNSLFKNALPESTQINDELMMVMKAKVKNMTNLEKICSVVIGTMSLDANLYYNIRQDKIIGFHDINGMQQALLANNALVLTVQGIIGKWKQPISFALISDQDIEESVVSAWIDDTIGKLFAIGLDVRTFVSDLNSDLINRTMKKKSVSTETPYFYVFKQKIYYILDPPYLLKLVRDYLMVHDFHFQGSIGKWEHIMQFYEKDKAKSLSLVPYLTDSHIKPNDVDKMKVSLAKQVLSRSVASAISTYVEFKAMEESAVETVHLISLINDLFDILNSSETDTTNEYKKAFSGNEIQITCLDIMFDLFSSLKLVDSSTGTELTENVKFIEGFQITIKSVLLLFNDLKQGGCNFMFTSRLHQNAVETFFEQIKSKSGFKKPTSRQFVTEFRKSLFSHLIKPPKRFSSSNNIRELHEQIEELKNLLNGLLTIKQDPDYLEVCVDPIDIRISVPRVTSSDYTQLDIPEKNVRTCFTGHLLKKCMEIHNCRHLKTYFQTNTKFASVFVSYRIHDKYGPDNLTIAIPNNFVKYVEDMDEQFRNIFTGQITGGVHKAILEKVNLIDFTNPCPCFPINYIKCLFIRMRIYYTIKYNNNCLRVNQGKPVSFSVPSL